MKPVIAFVGAALDVNIARGSPIAGRKNPGTANEPTPARDGAATS
jgi:hypothetical protein